MKPVDRGEIELPALLMRGAHRLELRRDVALDDAVGVANPAMVPSPVRDMDQLLRGGDERRLGLPRGYSASERVTMKPISSFIP